MNCIDTGTKRDNFKSSSSEWIEIDHASDDVDYSPKIDPAIYNYFDEIIDPEDERNVWIVPRENVHLLGEEVHDPEADGASAFSYSRRILLPDGRTATLVYEDASVSGEAHIAGLHRVVRLEVSDQLAFRLVNSLGKVVIR